MQPHTSFMHRKLKEGSSQREIADDPPHLQPLAQLPPDGLSNRLLVLKPALLRAVSPIICWLICAGLGWTAFLPLILLLG